MMKATFNVIYVGKHTMVNAVLDDCNPLHPIQILDGLVCRLHVRKYHILLLMAYAIYRQIKHQKIRTLVFLSYQPTN